VDRPLRSPAARRTLQRLPPRSIVVSTRTAAIAAALLAAAPPLPAQDAPPAAPACGYQDCALRVRYRVFGAPQIVQGRADRPLATIGFFAPRVAALEDAPAPVAEQFRAFRSAHDASTLLALGGGLLAAAGFFITFDQGWYRSDHREVAGAMLIGGTVMALIGAVKRTQAQDRLQRAIWLYNGTLPRP
jgi:hypothetical protein